MNDLVNGITNSPTPSQVGQITADLAQALNLSIEPGTPIYIGDTNIDHMRKKHPQDYERYGAQIGAILVAPDWVGHNSKDGSIEYVKLFVVGGEYVKVAVRVSMGGRLYVRSLYALNPTRVQNFIEKGNLIPLTSREE